MNYNLNSIIADLIAKPRTKDKEVLYTRVDDKMEQGDNTSRTPSEAYQVKSRTTANSPNNFRRLFITHESVAIQYHRLPKGEGSTLFKRYKYDEPTKKREKLIGDTSLKEVIAANYGLGMCTASNVQKISLQQGIAYKDIPVINGFGFGALARPWVYTNIEEIYIDWLPFMSSLHNGSCDISILTQKYGSDLSNPAIIPEILKEMILESCGVRDVAALCSKYPRLHTIAFIHNLEELVTLDEKAQVFFYDQDDITKRETSWIDQLRERGMIPNSKVSTKHAELRLVPNAAWMLKYTSRDGIYVFDRDTLRPYFENLSEKYKARYQKQVKETTPEVSYSENVTEIIELLLRIQKKFGGLELGIAIQSLMEGNELTRSEKEELFKHPEFRHLKQ